MALSGSHISLSTPVLELGRILARISFKAKSAKHKAESIRRKAQSQGHSSHCTSGMPNLAVIARKMRGYWGLGFRSNLIKEIRKRMMRLLRYARNDFSHSWFHYKHPDLNPELLNKSSDCSVAALRLPRIAPRQAVIPAAVIARKMRGYWGLGFRSNLIKGYPEKNDEIASLRSQWLWPFMISLQTP